MGYLGSVPVGGRYQTGYAKDKYMLIRFGSYTTRNVFNDRMESALFRMEQSNMDMGVFQQTRIVNGIYTRNLLEYNVLVTNDLRQCHGGVSVFYHEYPYFQVDYLHQFTPKLVISKLELRGRWGYVVK